MKLALTILSVSAALMATSCAPKDSKLTPPSTPRPGANPTTTDVKVDSNAESNKHLLVLLDRQVEALHLYRALTDADYAKAKAIFISEEKNGALKIKMSSVKGAALGSDSISEERMTSDVILDGQVSRAEDNSITAITVRENSEAAPATENLNYKAGEKTVTVSIVNKRKLIVFAKVPGSDEVNAKVSIIEEFAGPVQKAMIENETSFNFKLTGAQAEVYKIAVLHKRFATQFADLDMKADDSSVLAVNLDAAGITISGLLKLNSTAPKSKDSPEPLYKRDVKFEGSDLVVTDGKSKKVLIAYKLQENPTFRPIVDLKKLL